MKTDVQLQHDVLDELDWEPSVHAAQIGVTAKAGVVTLSGHVASHSERHTAEKRTKHVHGVRAVANEIEVRPPEGHLRDDEQIAAAALHALQWHSKAPADRLTLTVRHGRLTLEGNVDHRYEREAAERAVRHLVGVRGVHNAIVVAPAQRRHDQSVAERLKDKIERALQRSATVHADRISVEVDRHTVTLTGDVRSPAEHDEVERIAWTAREVDQVENCVTITPWGEVPMEEWGY